ncbi:transmembrane amino acid transporter protein-domain-containing protein [Geopyxis carbonaria]|nr:transmembrane amino acid transporter protein-domain-containing protein [Geopyxis carbonaria]
MARTYSDAGDAEQDMNGKPAAQLMTPDSGSMTVEEQKALEQSHDIKYRTCSWQKTAALLFSEYICLAIMSFPWSYSVLGLVPGLILTVAVAGSVLYTSLVLWRYCLRHPEVKDVCDIGQKLFWGKRWAWYATAVCFLLNNTFIQALHCLVGAKYLNTMSGHSICTVAFSAIIAVISFVLSIPRTFSSLAHAATFSAVTMFIAVVLAMGFAGSENHPAGYTEGTPVHWNLWPAKGTSYVLGMSAFLNISYTFIGQITIPSFIAEMENPKEFPRALWAVTICEIIVFSLAGSIMYVYSGNNYVTAPAFSSIGFHGTLGTKIAFTFAFPTIIFLGVLYASVSARFLFFRLFRGSRHVHSNTTAGWAGWAAILAVTWVLAFIIAEVIPFFSDLLSLMSALFDSFFGFIFWGVAWFRLREERVVKGRWDSVEWALNVFLIAVGVYFLTAGTYSTVQSIIDNYKLAAYGGVFSCLDNS